MPTHSASGNPTWLDYPSLDTPITAAALEASETALDRIVDRPVAEARLGSNAAIPAVTDTFAQGGWTSYTDSHGMVKLNPAAGTYTYLQVPSGWAGRYFLRYHSTTTGLGVGGAHAVKLARSTTGPPTVTNIATYVNTVPGSGADGATVDAITEIVLAAGDRIYWSDWVSVAATVPAVNLGVPTAIEARYIGPN